VPTARNRRRVLVVADQAASSLSNVVVAVLVARSFPDETEQFAAFSLALMVFQFAVGGVRGLLYDPLLALYSDRPRAVRYGLVPGYLGATFTVGLPLAGLIGLVSLALGGTVGSALLALAIVMPLVLVQDAWRYMFIVDRAEMALLVDVAWLLVSCGAILLAPDGVAVGWYVLAWGAGGILGAAIATVAGRRWLGRLRAWSYVAEHRDVSFRFLGEYVTSQAGNYFSLLACGWILGLTAYGAVRAANFYFGPIFTLQAGVILSTLPEGRRLRHRPVQLRRLVYGATALVSIAAAAWTAVGMVLPASYGRALFGATWAEAQDILLPMGLAMIGMTLIAGGLVGVRSVDATKGLRARLRSIPLQIVCPLAGAYIADVLGFAVGMALGQVLAAGVWWRTFLGLLGRQGAERAGDGEASTSTEAGGDTAGMVDALVATDEI
jgi:hypothetical protein